MPQRRLFENFNDEVGLKSAKKEIVLIDNYIDDTVLTLFSKYTDLSFEIITKPASKQLKLDIEKYNSQYKNLEIKISTKYHDRFIIIDKKQAYHLGGKSYEEIII